MSTVYGIVKQSGGYIEVTSEPGQGATFKVYLPRTGQSEKESTRHVNVSPRPIIHGAETILLVEDAEPMRKVVQRALRANGYNVLVAGTGEEAFRISKVHDGPIHLLLTDIVMPEISGREVAHRLAPSRPETRVLYTSGYTDGDIVTDGILEAGIVFLQKPFGTQDLVRKVREVLDATQAG